MKVQRVSDEISELLFYYARSAETVYGKYVKDKAAHDFSNSVIKTLVQILPRKQ